MYPKLIPDLLWSVLFLDVLVLLGRYGGMSVFDHLIHLTFLSLAALLLLLQERRDPLPRPLILVCIIPTATALLQLIHLPPDLLPFLAPLKAEAITQLKTLAPGLHIPTQITLIPELHRFKLAVWATDLITILLVTTAPRPSRRLIRQAPMILAALIAGFVVFSRIFPHAFLFQPYAETWAGLVNRNHFAVVMVLLLLVVAPHPVMDLLKLHRLSKGDEPTDPQIRRDLAAQLTPRCGLVLLILIAFGFSESRAGILLMLIGPLCLIALVLWKFQLLRRNRRTMATATAGGLLLLLLILPFGGGIQRLETEGFNGGRRAEVFAVGMDTLAKGPWLGAGLGATEAVLEAGAPKATYETLNWREFHNELLQIAVELGLPGLFALTLLLVWLSHRLLIQPQRELLRQRDLIFVLSVAAGLVVLLLHGLVSFPLRITAIRLLAILLTGLALKWPLEQHQPPAPTNDKTTTLALAPLIPFAWILLIAMNLRTHQVHPQDPPEVAQAVQYGAFHRKPMFRATHQLARILEEPAPLTQLNQRIQRSRGLFRAALEQQPKSLKSLNGLFMLEIIQVRLYSTHEDPQAYAAWRQKALAIQAMGHPNNHESNLALEFLNATFPKGTQTNQNKEP